MKLAIIADETVESNKLAVEHTPWSEHEEAAALLHGDIGIAPTPLNPWTLGKCGFKIVQYMACGLPVIASPVGANAQIVEDGRTGILANSPEEWEAAIIKLARDPMLRAQMGEAARARVEREYSLERAVATWSRVLASGGWFIAADASQH
jgi:glycosyltransferase involved in cell wall biosynthesis